MKKTLHVFATRLAVIIFCLLIAFGVKAQSFHTVSFTGAASDFTGETSYNGGNSVTYYITYDASNFYIGAFRTGGNTFGSGDNLAIYFDTDPNNPVTGGTGTTAGYPFSSVTPTLPFTANYTAHIQNNGNSGPNTGYNELRPWTSGTSYGSNTTMNDYVSTTALEIIVPFSSIGSPVSAYVTMFMGYSGGTYSFALNTNTTNSTTPAISNYYGGFGLTSAGCNPGGISGIPITNELLNGSASPSGSSGTIYGYVSQTSGSYTLPGSVTIANGGSVNVASGATLVTGSNTITMDAGSTVNLVSGGTLTNTGSTYNFLGAGYTTGTSPITFNNVTINSSVLTLTEVPSINGTLLINNGNVSAAPVYGAASTLEYNVSYGRYLEWNATGVGTIGTTAGYPNNVVINTGTYDVYNSASGIARALAGTLTVNNGATFGTNAMNAALTVGGGITINSGGTLAMGTMSAATAVAGTVSNSGTFTMSTTSGGDMTVAGNWTNSGTFTNNSRLITMNGSSTQTVGGTATTGFGYLTINNTSGGVALAANATVANVLTLTKGILTTTGYTLTVSNTANSGISGGANAPAAYVTGPLTWDIANASGNNYVFPVGAGGSYLPFTLNSPTGTSPVITVTAVGSAPSGSADGSTLSGSLAGEYWTATATGTYTTGTVSLLQQSSLGSLNAIARSTASNGSGSYSSLAGTISGNGINNSNATGSTLGSFTFGTLAVAAPAVTAVSVTTALNGQGANTGYVGQSINITGTNFPSNATVTFNGTSAYSVTWNSATSLSAVVNAGTSVATGTVVVTNPTTSGTGSAAFTNYGYISTAATDWNTASTWLDGAAVGMPTAGSTVTINNAVTVNASVTNAPATLTITSGNSLTFGSSGTLTVNATLTNGGSIIMTSGGVLTIAASGTLTNNGTFTGGTGTLNYAGAGTLNGSTSSSIGNLTINTGTITVSTVPTINGIFTINGGSVSAAPKYGSSSTLLYNVSYSRFNEWNASGAGTIGTTAGYPNNVHVSNNSTLDVADGIAGTSRAMAGNLTIDAGSTLSMNVTAMTQPVIVAGNVSLAGTLTLSSASGGDIKLGGNWAFTSGGTFNSNTRAVFFTGSALQSISRSAAGTLNFDYIINSNTSGGIQLASSPATSVNVNAPNGGNGLSWSSSTTNFDLNGNSLNLTANQSIGISGADNIISSTGTGYVTVNTGTVSSVSGSGTLALGSAVTVSLYGGLDFGSNLSTVNGTLLINAGGYVNNDAPYYATGSLLQYYSGTSPYVRGTEWSAASGTGYPYNVEISNNTSIDAGGTSFTGTALDVANNLTVDAGSGFYMDYSSHNMTVPLNVNGNVIFSGAVSESGTSGGDINIEGNWTNNGTSVNFYPNGRAVSFIGSVAQTIGGSNSTSGAYGFAYLTINNSAGVTLNTPATVANTLTMTAGVLNTTTTNILTLTNTASSATSGGTTTSFIKGPLNWTLASNLSSDASVYNFPLGAGSTYLPVSITTVTTGSTGPVVQMQAFNTGCGGSAGTGLSSISSTEYWKASVVSGNYSSASVSLTRQSTVGSLGVMGESSTVGGTYAYEGGTGSGDAVNNSNLVGAGYYVISTSIGAPTITSVVPTPSLGGQANNTGYTGQTIVITGTNFPSNATVTLGGSTPTSVSYVSSTQLNVVVSTGTTGSLIVTNPTTSATATAAFTYLGYITTAGTDWNTGSTWLGGSVPPTGATTTVNTNTTVNGTVSNNPATVTVNSGSALTFGASGALSISGTLTFAGTVDMTSGGTLNFTNNGTFTNNGAFTYGTGTVNFTGNAGTSSVLGSNATTFYNVSIAGPTAGINFGNPPSPSNSTVVNNFTIYAGGFVVLHAPDYAANSTLVYNTGSSYNRNVEWSELSNPAYPYNVLVTGNTTLNMSFGSGLSDGTARAIAGLLTVNSGSSVIMNAMTTTMTTNGLALNGSLTLSSAVGGDYIINGNWTNNGSFVPNTRAVQFSGSSAQTITGATAFDYLTIDNSNGVSLNNNITVSTTLTFTTGNLTLGANNITLSSSATIAGAGASGYVQTNSTGQMKETVGNSAVYFTVGNAAYNPIVLTNSGTSDVYGINVLDGTFAANNSNKIVNERWQINEAVAGGSNLAVKLQWNSSEDASNFASGTNDYIGFYYASSWGENPATQAGSNPYTFTSTSNFTPTNITTGTQYFAVGKDNAFLCASLVAPVISGTNVSCNGASDGVVTVSTLPTGGLSPYTYSIDGGATYQSSTSFTGLAPTSYSVIAQDNNGCTSPVSNALTITQPAVLAVILTGGLSPICYNGDPGVMTATASGGTGTYTYTWYYFNGVISGATASTYDPGNLVTLSNEYEVKVTSGTCGTVPSSITYITVDAPLTASITGGVSPICYNSLPGTFTATGTGGTGTYAYQWYNTAGSVSGATASTFAPGNITVSDAYSCQVTSGSCGTATSNTINIAVDNAISAALTGGDPSVCYNTAPSTLIATGSGGTGGYTYQWYNTAGAIGGETANTYSPGNMTTSDVFYCILASGSCGSATTNSLSITVNAAFSATISGGTTPICYNSSPGTFTATAVGGTGTYTYQWFDGSGLVPGEISSTYVPGNLTSSNSYFCQVISGSCGIINTSVTNITVRAIVSASLLGGTSPVCYNTSPGTFTALGNGAVGPYSYQWYNTSGSIGGASASTYSPGNLTTSDSYYCAVTAGTCGVTNTGTRSITVDAALTASISGGTSPVCYNSNPGTFTATGNGGDASYTYQWYNSSGIIGGAAASTYTPGNLTSSDEYYCSVTSSTCGATVTGTTNITVNGVLSSVISGGTSPLCYNTAPGSFTATTSGGDGSFTYQWFNTSGSISGAVASTYAPGNLIASDAYYCSVTSASCGTATTSTTSITVSGSIAASASNTGPYVIGQTISLSALPGSETSYSWAGPLSYSAAGQTSTRTGATTGMSGVYTVTVSDASGCSATATTTVVVNTTATYTWTGTTSTDWTVITNWSPVSPVGGPNATNVDVIIPSVLNNPVLGTTVSIGNLQINSNAVLTLNANINVYKNLVGGTGANAIFNGTGILILAGASAQTISGATQVQELKLNNTAGAVMQSSSALDVYVSLDLQTGNFNASSGALTFKSNSVSNVGIIDNFSAGFGGSLTGNITAERYYAGSGTYNQHFMGSPINNPSLSQFGASGTPGAVSDPTCSETQLAANSPYGNLFTLNQASGTTCGMEQWTAVVGGNTTNGIGYSYRQAGSGTLILSGGANLNTSYTVSNLDNSGWSNNTLQGHTLTSGWQLVSNPYLATLNLSTISSDMDYQIQVWNANGPFSGTYQPGTVGTDATVAPFQAFMIHKTSIGTGGSFTINASDRKRTAQTFYIQNANQLNIIAANTANGQLDQTMIAFNPAATDSFDVQYDADKLPGSLNRHTLYTVNMGKWMSRNVLHDEATTSTVPMGFEPGANGTYTLTFNGLNTFDPTSYIYLEDKTLNVMYNVRNGNYTFTSDSADNWNRFVLHFTPPAIITTADANCTTTGAINIQQPGTANWNYTITDAGNAIITSGTLNQSQQVTVGVPAGTYTLTLIDTNSYTIAKTIIVNGPEIISAAFDESSSSVQVEQNVTLTSTTANASTYNWNLGNGTAATGAVTSVSYAQPGVYTISLSVTNTAGCSSVKTQTVTVNPTGTTGLANVSGTGNLKIWSNANKVYVDFTALQSIDANVIIYDILGQQISNDKVTSASQVYQREIDNIDAAYFIVMVRNDDKITTKKVFIINSR